MAASHTQLYAFKWGGSGDGPSKKAERLYREARSAYGSADYSKVIDLTSKAIVEYEKFAKAYALRGKARKDMGDIEKAFKDLNRAIEFDPKLGEAFYIRGQANEIMGEMKKAGADYKKGCAAGFRSACE
jgi:tetratricopeptide (TPR) repeat protein